MKTVKVSADWTHTVQEAAEFQVLAPDNPSDADLEEAVRRQIQEKGELDNLDVTISGYEIID